MNDSNWRPRLSIQITEDQARSLQNLIPWGLKNQLFSVIVDDVIRISQKLGSNFIAAILAKSIKLEDWSSVFPKEEQKP